MKNQKLDSELPGQCSGNSEQNLKRIDVVVLQQRFVWSANRGFMHEFQCR